MRWFLASVCGVLLTLAAASAWWYSRQPDLFLLHGRSRLYDEYGGPERSQGPAPARAGEARDQSRARIARLFEDFYVVKDGATDCSFVAALMLVLRHDRDYPLRVVFETPDGYLVRFPGLPAAIPVTRDALRLHRATWLQTREPYRFILRGHLPDGLEVLRRAYYDYQAAAGIRGTRGSVHAGGAPAQDLIALSGARVSHSFVSGSPGEPLSRSSRIVKIETRLGGDGRFSSTVVSARVTIQEVLLPFLASDKYLIVASSSLNAPRISGRWIVPNHAYYCMGKTADGTLVLGNSYQTRRPLTATPADFARSFRAIDFVAVADIPAPPSD